MNKLTMYRLYQAAYAKQLAAKREKISSEN
jgi:hypothetical protein